MAERRELEAWVGKYVQVLVTGDSEPLIGVLEGWHERGVVLRYTQGMARLDESHGEGLVEDTPTLNPLPVVGGAARFDRAARPGARLAIPARGPFIGPHIHPARISMRAVAANVTAYFRERTF
jgi:hypothetical protein